MSRKPRPPEDLPSPSKVRTLSPPYFFFREINFDFGGGGAKKIKDNVIPLAWGENGNFQLGLGVSASSYAYSPTEITSFSRSVNFAQISSGASHTVALATNGTVYSWGSNSYSQLGIGNAVAPAVPVMVTFFDGISVAEVYAFSFSSFARTTSGDLYGWGSNTFGQLGMNGTQTPIVNTPLLLWSGVKAVAGGDFHTIVLFRKDSPASPSFFFFCNKKIINLKKTKENGTVFSVGGNDNGQLCLGNNNSTDTPVQIDFFNSFTITQISAGGSTSAFVTC